MAWLAILLLVLSVATQAREQVGVRPYEMDWAGRTQDDNPPLIDFEDLTGWTVETTNAEASLERSREQQIWGRHVGKVTYRSTGGGPQVRLLPPEPIAIDKPFDAVSMWVWGNNWFGRDKTTPCVTINAVFADSEGAEFQVYMGYVRWKEWFLCHRRLSPEHIARVEGGATFRGLVITNGHNKQDRVIYLDNLAVFTEQFPPLKFEPRRARGISMFPGQGTGTNTGPGTLPFPNREQTILPTNLETAYKTRIAQDGDVFVFTYDGKDAFVEYRYEPDTGTWSDLSAKLNGLPTVKPCIDGGVYLAVEGNAVLPETREHLGTERQGDEVVSRWRVSTGDVSAEVAYTYRLWQKSLVIDTVARGGNVAEVRYGYAEGLQSPRLVTNPYYTCDNVRPAVAVSGAENSHLFLAGNTDWYLSNASMPWASNRVLDDHVEYNGGTRYVPLTNGKRNDCYERFFITLTDRYVETLPTVANPVSQWKQITGTKVWRAHGAGNRDNDKAYWKRAHRYGMREVVVTDHETMWRDGGESFTFRTKAAPGKGGDEGAIDYSHYMQDELGFTYGPYNNFTDFAPVNEFWSYDLISRTPDNQLQNAWTRCYAPKPARAVEYCAKLAPFLDEKFGFSTAYCDVHTAVTPWSRTDYDYRVPGAGTFAAVYYAYGEIMLLQKAAWDGPVYSEGGNHWMYCGLTDGNYGQDQRYNPAVNPWLVDFDLRKLHDLCCNFGMGNVGMFFGRNASLGRTREEMDASIDRFLAATVAFGHPGFLVFDGGMHNALRSYYMLQQLHSRYCLASADEIRYANAAGDLLDTSTAVVTGDYKRSQVVTRYSDGTVTVANGSPGERMKVTVDGRSLDLPPNGYAGWTADGQIEAISADPDGHRCDYTVTPAHTYVDGRGKFMRFEKAAGDGIGICRNLPDGRHEVILYEGAECGFAVDAQSAVALDYNEKPLGAAEIRHARGLTYVMPVEGAFSYILDPGPQAAGDLTAARDEVVPGETVLVQGEAEHQFLVPDDAREGDRIWQQFEGKWIDFTVVPLAYADVSLDGNTLTVALTSNIARAADFEASLDGATQSVTLEPGAEKSLQFDLGEPAEEGTGIIAIKLTAGELSSVIERGMAVLQDFAPVAELPDGYEVGMAYRGQQETGNFGTSRGRASAGSSTCNGIKKKGLNMHPPYMGGVGYSYALYDPMRLPETPKAAFRASVGKGDGSDLGDGILYKVGVVDEAGEETIVASHVVDDHRWDTIAADLTPWAGKQIRIKIISDVGEGDNSSGDWACWADMRLETVGKVLLRRLEDNVEMYRREAGPYPVAGLTVEDLRAAKRGWLHYDGMGLSGNGESYGSFAVVNGVELGNMAPAGGSETQGIWEENVAVELSPEAIATLGFRNQFELRNPKQDWFKVRRFWIELELADGRKASSLISTCAYTQPPSWPYAEGIGVPHGENITVEIWFDK